VSFPIIALPRRRAPHDTLDAVREFAKRGRIFSLQEVKNSQPDLNMSLLFEVSSSMTRAGEVKRLSKGIFIPTGCAAPAEQAVKAVKLEAKQADLQSDPLLGLISTPRHTTDLLQQLGVTRGTIIRRLERLEREGLATRRSINGGIYVGRTEADLDRKEEELRARPHPVARRILEVLPEAGAVRRTKLLGRSDIGFKRGDIQLDRLVGSGLVEIFSFSESQYVTLTDAGRQHPLRMEGTGRRMPTTDWHGENYARRLGILMVVDTLGTAMLNDVRATVPLLSPCFQSGRPAHIAKQMIEEGFLEDLDTALPKQLGLRRVAVAPKGAEIVRRLRQIEAFPKAEHLQTVIDEQRKSKPVRCRSERRLSPVQRAVLKVLDSAGKERSSKQISGALPKELSHAHTGGAMGGLEKRGLVLRLKKTRSGMNWKITEAGRATLQTLA